MMIVFDAEFNGCADKADGEYSLDFPDDDPETDWRKNREERQHLRERLTEYTGKRVRVTLEILEK